MYFFTFSGEIIHIITKCDNLDIFSGSAYQLLDAHLKEMHRDQSSYQVLFMGWLEIKID